MIEILEAFRMKKILIFFLLLTNINFLYSLTIKNQYIEFGINDLNHRLELFKTTGGVPEILSDDNKYIIHQKDLSECGVYIFVDGKPYKVGLAGKNISSPFYTNNKNGIVSVWNTGKVIVRQIAEIAEGPTSGLPDSIKLTYILKNNDSIPHEIGVKIVIDTFIGANDNYPFFVPLNGVIEREKRISSIPDYFVAIDSIEEPTVELQVTLLGPGLAGPDSIVFASPDLLNSCGWNIPVDSEKQLRNSNSGLPDTAYALFWGPITFPASTDRRSTKKISTMLGITTPEVQRQDMLDIALIAPRNIKSGSFSTIVLLQNKDRFRSIKNLKVELSLPDGCSITSEIPSVFSIPEIIPDSIKFLYYNIDAKSMSQGESTISVKVTGEANNSIIFNNAKRRIRK